MNNAGSSVLLLSINCLLPVSFCYCDCSNTATALNFSAVDSAV